MTNRDIALPSVIPYGYTILTAVNFTYFYYSKNFSLVRFFQVLMSLLLPFFSSLAKIVVLRSDSIEEALHNRLEMPPFTGHLTGGAQDGLSMFGSMLSNDIGQG